jgi:hypothetical protein
MPWSRHFVEQLMGSSLQRDNVNLSQITLDLTVHDKSLKDQTQRLESIVYQIHSLPRLIHSLPRLTLQMLQISNNEQFLRM